METSLSDRPAPGLPALLVPGRLQGARLDAAPAAHAPLVRGHPDDAPAAAAAVSRTRLSERPLMNQMPVIVAVGVNLGVVPLLFTQVAYYRVFYPAGVLMAWPWFLGDPAG